MPTNYQSFLDQDPNDLLATPPKRGLKMSGVPYTDAEMRTMPLETRPGVPLEPMPKPLGRADPNAPTMLTGASAPRIGIGKQDEQLLEALGPEYAAEAQRQIALPSAQRQPITGKNLTTGESFVMPVGPRVSRQTLEPALQRIAVEKLKREREQQQATAFGRQKELAMIPGQAAVDLAKTRGDYALRGQESEQNFQRPEQQARIGESQQRVAGARGAESRAQRQFDESMDPQNKQRLAADAAIKALQDSGVANTPEGRQTIAALTKFSTVGSRLPADTAEQYASAANQPNPEQQLATLQEFAADPQVAKLLQSIQANKPGIFPSADRGRKQVADRKALDAYINRYAQAKGVDPNELRTQIESQLVGTESGSVSSLPGLQFLVPGGIGAPNMFAGR